MQRVLTTNRPQAIGVFTFHQGPQEKYEKQTRHHSGKQKHVAYNRHATQIAGYGTYSFNTSSASDSSYSPCAGMGRDVFWAWTAQATANVTLSTCGASFDTVLAVYNGGGCPTGGAISCNDDSCNLQSSVSISAVAGQTYLVQVGSWNGNSSGSGSLDMASGTSCNLPGLYMIRYRYGCISI